MFLLCKKYIVRAYVAKQSTKKNPYSQLTIYTLHTKYCLQVLLSFCGILVT